MTVEDVLPLDISIREPVPDELSRIASSILRARAEDRPVLLFMGAHVIKQGLSRFVIDLMDRGLITHVAGNGACCIHDYELSKIGATTESVARYLRDGEFGLWRETGEINAIISRGVEAERGFGESVGRAIEMSSYQHRSLSILAAGWRFGTPVTIHVGIGQDILHEHPNFDPAATGQASYWDFLAVAEALRSLKRGVILNFGTAVMGPEVFQKALSMARNVVHRSGKRIDGFTTAVFDLVDLGEDTSREADREEARYYFRPFKTMLVRGVQDGGEGIYVRADHRITLPALRSLLLAEGTS